MPMLAAALAQILLAGSLVRLSAGTARPAAFPGPRRDAPPGTCDAAEEDFADLDFDADEGLLDELWSGKLLHLLQRRGEYVAKLHAAVAAAPVPTGAPAAERSPDSADKQRGAEKASPGTAGIGMGWPEASAGCTARAPAGAHGWSRLDVLEAVTWQVPKHIAPTFAHVTASIFASLPAAVAYGLLWILGGCGSLQVVSTLAFWVIVRPAAAALEAVRLYEQGCPGAPVTLVATHATTAHFFWTWGLLELATRQRSLGQRLLAAAALATLCLPIPFAQVLLGVRTPEQAMAGSVLGALLGLGFFFALRVTHVWTFLQAWETEVPAGSSILAFWLHPRDNLTSFWGGSMCAPVSLSRRQHKLAMAMVPDATAFHSQ